MHVYVQIFVCMQVLAPLQCAAGRWFTAKHFNTRTWHGRRRWRRQVKLVSGDVVHAIKVVLQFVEHACCWHTRAVWKVAVHLCTLQKRCNHSNVT